MSLVMSFRTRSVGLTPAAFDATRRLEFSLGALRQDNVPIGAHPANGGRRPASRLSRDQKLLVGAPPGRDQQTVEDKREEQGRRDRRSLNGRAVRLRAIHDRDRSDPGHRAQTEKNLRSRSRRAEFGEIDAIARIMPATSGTSQARNRNRVKKICDRPPNRSAKY